MERQDDGGGELFGSVSHDGAEEPGKSALMNTFPKKIRRIMMPKMMMMRMMVI